MANRTFLAMLLETSGFLEHASKDAQMTKEELIMSVENRVSIMISKAVVAPMGSSFSIFEEEPASMAQRLAE
jgi:uncharacterized membrane protein